MRRLVARLACSAGLAVSIWASLLAATCSTSFEPEQHLIFGQRLGARAKMMTLQFLDDLTEPFVLHALGNQHCL